MAGTTPARELACKGARRARAPIPELAAAPDAAAAETIVTAPDRWRAGPIQEPVEIAVVRSTASVPKRNPVPRGGGWRVGVIGQILTLLAELTALRQSKAVADGRRVACPVGAGHGLGGWWARQDSNLRQRRYERLSGLNGGKPCMHEHGTEMLA